MKLEVTRLTSERPFNPARLCSTWRLTAWAVTPWREGRAVVSTRAEQAGTDGDAVLQVRVRHAAPRHRQVQGGPDGELLPQRDLQVPVPGMCAAGWAREAAGSAWRRRRLSPVPRALTGRRSAPDVALAPDPEGWAGVAVTPAWRARHQQMSRHRVHEAETVGGGP